MRALSSLPLLAAAALVGCATAQHPDPLEPMNRKVFAFNEGVDKVVLKPVASAYQAVVPDPVRSGVTNFFANATDPWSAVNLMLQGRVTESFSDLARFGTNTVVGVLGFIDVATKLGLPRHGEDFGQTLGHWGVAPGAYLVLPLLGPSTLRDSAGLPVDLLAAPQGFIDNVPLRNSLTALQSVNQRANLLKTGEWLDDAALDKYLFVRDAWLQRRRSLVDNGKPPADDDPERNAPSDRP